VGVAGGEEDGSLGFDEVKESPTGKNSPHWLLGAKGHHT